MRTPIFAEVVIANVTGKITPVLSEAASVLSGK